METFFQASLIFAYKAIFLPIQLHYGRLQPYSQIISAWLFQKLNCSGRSTSCQLVQHFLVTDDWAK